MALPPTDRNTLFLGSTTRDGQSSSTVLLQQVGTPCPLNMKCLYILFLFPTCVNVFTLQGLSWCLSAMGPEMRRNGVRC